MSEPTPNDEIPTPEQIREAEEMAASLGMTVEELADRIRIGTSKALHFDEPPPKP